MMMSVMVMVVDMLGLSSHNPIKTQYVLIDTTIIM